MDARSAIELLGWSFVLPAGVSMASLFLLRRCLPGRLAAGTALTIAMLTGFAVMNTADGVVQRLQPTRHWHWVAWLPAIGLFVFGIGFTGKVGQTRRISVLVILAALATYLLVPDWPPLDDKRNLYRFLLCVIAAAACGAVSFSIERVQKPRWLLLLLGGSLLAMTPLLAVFLSLTYATLMSVAAAAVLGLTVVRSSAGEDEKDAAQIAAPIAAMLLVAGCFIGFVETNPPLFGFLPPLLVPALIAVYTLGSNHTGSLRTRFIEMSVVVTVFAASAGCLHLETRTVPPDELPADEQPVEGKFTEEDWFDSLDKLDADSSQREASDK